jgi:hypothetical protein
MSAEQKLYPCSSALIRVKKVFRKAINRHLFTPASIGCTDPGVAPGSSENENRVARRL